MPLPKPTTTFLIPIEYLYAFSGITAESGLLPKNLDKIFNVNFFDMPKHFGQVCTNEIIAAKDEADRAEKEENEDWSDKIGIKYKTLLINPHFIKWYALAVRTRILSISNGELRADGLVRIERELPNGTGSTSHVSATTFKYQLDQANKELKEAEANLYDCVIKPNMNAFECLRNRYGSENKNPLPKTKSLFVVGSGGGKRHRQSHFQQQISIEITQNINEKKNTASYNYSASPSDGNFMIDYSTDITESGENLTAVIVNSVGVTLTDFDYEVDNYPDAQFAIIRIMNYANTDNLTGTIAITISG